MAVSSGHVAIKRAYEQSASHDGTRILVDRLWARGVSKEGADLDAWMKELGPSTALRTWFSHQPDRWEAFQVKYRHELKTPLRQLLLAELQGVATEAQVTLVYGAHDTQENEAVVLRDYLLQEHAHPDATWDAPTKLLLTAAVVAAAHPDAVAPTSGLQRLASAILSAYEIDTTLKELVTRGSLCETAGGWQLTSHALEHVRQLSQAT